MEICLGIIPFLPFYLQARFKVDKPWQQDYIFKQMGELWRASKSRLVTKLRDAPNNEERLKLKPDNIKSNVEWKAFVREKTSVEFTVTSMAC